MRSNAAVIALAGGLVIAAAVGGGLWWYTAARGDTTPKSADADAAQRVPSAAADKGRVLYWHDPMVPGPKFDKPGKSPFMDMQLVPVYANAGADEGKVTISARTVQNLGIRTAEVRQGDTSTGLSTVGTVAIDERLINSVQTRVTGYVEKLYVRAQFDPVRRGQPLAEIYAPDWLAAQEEYLTLKRSALPASNELAAAARARLVLLGVSEQQIQRIERDNAPNPRVTLYAPESGVVWELGTRDGQQVSPGMTLFKLVGLSTVWVNAEVPEAQASWVLPGSAVEARSAAAPGMVLKGKVAAILPDVNATTRTIKARVVLPNPGGRLQPGMFASLTFAGDKAQGLMVPSESVIYTGRRNVVIVAEGDGKFRPVDVEVGGERGDATEIRRGLEAGQRVVASGQFLIDSEASLKSALTRLNDAAAPSASGTAAARGSGSQATSAAPRAATFRATGKVIAIEGGR
ncbi:MAG: efflux RND transporter periplasmic adaptor subunit, partial [Casimicrobiaceae bacterium]